MLTNDLLLNQKTLQNEQGKTNRRSVEDMPQQINEMGCNACINSVGDLLNNLPFKN